MTEKESQARDLAESIAWNLEVDFDPEDIQIWELHDVYEWLEVGWGFVWDGEEWTRERLTECVTNGSEWTEG